MATEKNISSRIQHKHDTASNWSKATNFIPKDGELIIYDPDSSCAYTRLKIGNGSTVVADLPFFIDYKAARKDYVDEIFATYILEIDYDRSLGFNINENPFVSTLNDGLLGTIILGM